MSIQRNDPFMNGIEYPVWLGKEIFLHFIRGRDPVAGSDHHGMLEDPAAIAARRYAEGEISREEYLRGLKDLKEG